jgi:hypothetical protein
MKHYHSDTQEKIECITYTPGLQESGDLEAATKNITAIAEPGNPDYITSLLVPTPDDDRLKVLRLGVRLQITVDSWSGGGSVLNYRIKRNAVSIGTGTLTSEGGTGALYTAHDVTEPAGALTGPGNYEIYLWVNTGSCVISEARVWGGVGTTSSSFSVSVIEINYTGICYISCFHYLGAGSGDHEGGIARSPIDINNGLYGCTTGNSWITILSSLLMSPTFFLMWGSVRTDIHAIQEFTLVTGGMK